MTDEASRTLDRRELLLRVEGDLDLLVAIVDTFLSRLPRHLEQIETAVRSGDAATLSESAHALKGSVANFSLGPVYRISSRLEEIGKSGGTSDSGGRGEADELLPSLGTAARELETELRSIATDARSGYVPEDL